MKDSILEKLTTELRSKIRNESQVLYILAQTRKYLEEYEPYAGGKYENLYFVCNWVLHITMDHPRTIGILQKFDRYFEKMDKGYNPDVDVQFLQENSNLFF